MSELEPLATELRRELGDPPDAWVEAQRQRARSLLRRPLPRRGRALLVPALAVAVVVALLVGIGLSRRATPLERWLVAEELAAPFRLPDGSTIALATGSRGRLHAAEDGVRFDLHAGRATFDVTPRRGQSFTVTAGRSEVHVVGTRFSVTYGPSDALAVEVEHGIVSVLVPERSSRVELEAGDRLERAPGQMALFHGRTARGAAPESPASAAAREAGPPVTAPSADVPVRPLPVEDWQARYREGKYAASLALVRSSGLARRLGELGPKELTELADVARLGGDPALAVRALEALLERFPGSAEAGSGRFLLGRVHALSGDRARAVAAFERYLASGGSLLYEAEAIGRLMELYSSRGDAEKARAAAERYLARAPGGPYRRLAESLSAQKH